ncbi:hypothetical protein QBC45DRAFT_60136 [Copromyces sp. CBS 386.78]|nr:hypothetical protein QBC45DRAFT_60136 [Copromyces sp. CBS 386.78]
MATQNPVPGTHGRAASEEDPRSQSTSAEQHAHSFDQEYFLSWEQPAHMSSTNPAQDGWDVGGDSVALSHDNQDESPVLERLYSVSQTSHYEHQSSGASYPSLSVHNKESWTKLAPTPLLIPFKGPSEQDLPDPFQPAALSYPTPSNRSQSPQLAAAASAVPVASVTAATHPTLQVPYPGRTCSICGTNFVWKKSASRCFDCCRNRPRPRMIAAVIERAARGIDSCSTCYGEADRGENKLCAVCYERQKGKSRRSQARQKAKGRTRKAREAAEAIFKGLGIAFDQPCVTAN